jgi:multisubunit Na+/H+ antiporter MnhE subunit
MQDIDPAVLSVKIKNREDNMKLQVAILQDIYPGTIC